MQTREEFLKARKRGIGGSDSAAIVGVSPYTTPLQLYLEKTGQWQKQTTDAQEKIFERGNILEPFLRNLFQKDFGFEVEETSQKVHKTHDYIIANVDGLIREDNAIIEFKTRSNFSKYSFGNELTDEIPNHYLLQCHHYLLVHENCNKVYLAVLDCNQEVLNLLTELVKTFGANCKELQALDIKLKLYIVHKDENHKKLAQLLYEKYDIFWNQHVLPQIPPAYSSFEDVKILFPTSSDNEVVADEKIENEIKEIKESEQIIKEIEKKIEEKKSLVCSFLQNASKLISSDGKKIATWSQSNRKTFDISELKKNHTDLDLEKYYKITSSKTFRIY